MKPRFIITILMVFFSLYVYSQNGIIRGRVFDAETGEYLPGVTIFADGTTSGTITDLDGNFNLSINRGIYNIRISFISYETVILENIQVKGNEVISVDDIGMHTANINIEEVVVTGQSIRNTENSMISLKKSSVNVMDGISAASFRKIGDSDAASSMKRVSGVSVTGGKYVFVRGLGDRYTKTILNGVDIPGLDPDRNTIQMDLFPTNVIDNIIVHKSFSPELPADFTGGIIDIEIKDFPTKKHSGISLGLGLNPDQHFNASYLKYNGGATDFLGFDDGTRAIPAKENIPNFVSALVDPDGEEGLRYKEVLNAFNPTMAAMQGTSLMDLSLGATFGNQLVKENRTIGYNFSLSYKNNTEFYTGAIDSRYGLSGDASVNEMQVREYQEGNYGVNSTFLSGLAGFAVKDNYSKYRFYLLHLQNGESKAGIFDFEGSDQGSDFISKQQTLDYSQRTLTNILIDGKHIIDDTNWELEWKFSPTLSIIYDPDVRFTRYEINDNGGYEIGTEVGFPERIWRNLFEVNVGSTVHANRNYEFNGRKAKLKFGAAHTFKYRDYIIRKFLFNVRGGADGNLPLTGDPNELLTDALKWPYNNDISFGTTYETDLNKSNQYNAYVNYIASYVATDLPLSDKVKTAIGFRLEKYDQNYTGQNQLGTRVLNNDKVLSDFNIFPSINLIYSATQNINLRGSYSRTIARPSMKELSFAEIYDPLSGRTFIGGLHDDKDPITGESFWSGELQSTMINNYDVRWEYLARGGSMLSLSGFYKQFRNPIEMVQFATQTGAFQPRNVGDGQVLGGEFELRQNLGFISESLATFGISSNVTFTESRIEMSITEYNSRVINARTGQVIDTYRDMAGQAPYIINAGISYDGNGAQSGTFFETFEAGVYYNVQGTTLQFVGIADRPDIYSLPFHSLNVNTNMAFGAERNITLNIKIENLLGGKREMVFKSYEAADQYFEFRDPGMTFSVGLGYSFD